jgi:hypothetical protein
VEREKLNELLSSEYVPSKIRGVKPIRINDVTSVFERLREYEDSVHALMAVREACFNAVRAFRKHFAFADEFGERVNQKHYKKVVKHFLDFADSGAVSREEKNAIQALSSEELFDRMRSANLRGSYVRVLEKSGKKSELLKEFKAALAWSVLQRKLKK